MLNSVDTGRRLMQRAALYPLVAIAVASIGCLLLGPRWSAGLVFTGLATVLGGWVSAQTALGGGIQTAGVAMTRLILAIVFKWVLVFTALLLGFALWRLPALALVAGIGVGLMFQVLALARR